MEVKNAINAKLDADVVCDSSDVDSEGKKVHETSLHIEELVHKPTELWQKRIKLFN